MALTSIEAKNTLNKIDSSLKEVFENVDITKIDNVKESYFKIEVSTLKSKKTELPSKVVVHIKEHAIAFGNGSSLMWEYATNPMNEKSQTISRISTINTFSDDIATIICENRFSKDYLDMLTEEVSKSINESNTEDDDDKDFIDGNLFEFSIGENVEITDSEETVTISERYQVGSGSNMYNMYKVKVGEDIQEVAENLIIKKD